jgi:hypothetical protein
MTATLTRTRKPRKPALPVHGTVRVLRAVCGCHPGAVEVEISGKPYYLARHETGYRLHGYDPRRGVPTCYDLPSDLSSCDCPDSVWCPDRPEGCKHRKALLALRAAGKLS